MNSAECTEIADWFMENYSNWVLNRKLLSWAGKLGIRLNQQGKLDEGQLFHLFALAVLWNNRPTFKAEKGEQVFLAVRNSCTLERFKEAETKSKVWYDLKTAAVEKIGNPYVFNLLQFIAGGGSQKRDVWQEITDILKLPNTGNRSSDVDRLRQLYDVFNPKAYEGNAYFTVKVFLVFRELRIQFKETGRYQYSPTICCIPDSHVREELVNLDLLQHAGNDIDNLITASEIVAEHFCTNAYELYDLPLFFWHKKGKNKPKGMAPKDQSEVVRGRSAGVCPSCGSPLVWRRAGKTRELYRGCTNFDGGCRWKDRSY